MAISYVNSTNASNTNTTATLFNTSASNGDLLIGTIMWCSQSSGANTAFTWPAGWTVINSTFSNDVVAAATVGVRIEVAWKFKVSTDSFVYNITVPTNTSGGWQARTHMLRGTDTTAPIIASNIGTIQDNSTADPTSTPTLTDATSDIWAAGSITGMAVVASRTWDSYSPTVSERLDGSVGTGTYRLGSTTFDSNGVVDASSGYSVTATPNSATYVRCGSLQLVQPPAVTVKPASCGILIG